MYKNSLLKDTLILTIIELIMQVMALVYNIFITKLLGSASMGIISLIYSFFGFISVISSGNIFVCISRFTAEELGKPNGNPSSVFSYGMIFSMILSISASAAVFISAEQLGQYFLKNADTVIPIRIMALCLPLTALSACIKGLFNAYRKSGIVAAADAMEFIVRSGVTAFMIEFFVINNRLNIFSAIAISILTGEAVTFIFLIAILHIIPEKKSKGNINLRKFIKMALPITINSYITVILSSIHEALLPITLKQFSSSTEIALSQYGLLEAIIMPCIYFPSVILSCLSGILVPEISMANGAKNAEKSGRLIEKSIKYAIWYSFFAINFMIVCGDEIGIILSDGNEFAGQMIKIFAFVIPFIYLEIILESIIKAIGLQEFSTINYIAEYLIRISVLLVCVRIMGFYGIVISYYSSNIIGNTARIIMISKKTAFSFKPFEFIIMPVLSIITAYQTAKIFCCMITNQTVYMISYTLISGAIYLLILRCINKCNCSDKKISRDFLIP